MSERLARALYCVAVCALLPLVLGYFWLRGRREPDYRKGWCERLGVGPPVAGRPLWIHAASVGEVGLAEPLVRALHARDPDQSLLVTTFTPTGAERVRTRLGDIAQHCYVPLDTPGAVRRFMQRVQPRAGVIIETELWPNLLHAAARARVPVLLANASISARSAARYRARWLAPLMCSALQDIVAIGAASATHAERFVELGAHDNRVHVTGNLKYDIAPDADAAVQGAALRGHWNARQRPVWVAASTHEGEEAAVLAAHRELLKHCPGALLVLAPRHPQRFPAVADLLAAEGWQYAAHADGAPVNEYTEVVFGNTLGDVPRFYAAADVAFVGGSLVPGIGGHNVLEAALLARPVLVGPHIGEWQEVTDALVEACGAAVVANAEALAQQLRRWLQEPDEANAAGLVAQAAARKEQGALGRTLELLGRVGFEHRPL